MEGVGAVLETGVEAMRPVLVETGVEALEIVVETVGPVLELEIIVEAMGPV